VGPGKARTGSAIVSGAESGAIVRTNSLSVTTCLSGMAAGPTLLEPVHRPLAVARRLFLLGIDAWGLAVSIAVTTPARHAGSHGVRMRGLGHRNTMSALSDRFRPSRRSML
jgi:hypothetical protein